MSGTDHYGIPWRYATEQTPWGGTRKVNRREAPCTICKQWRNVKTGRRYTVTDGTDAGTKHFFCCGRCRSGKTIKEMAVELRPWSEGGWR